MASIIVDFSNKALDDIKGPLGPRTGSPHAQPSSRLPPAIDIVVDFAAVAFVVVAVAVVSSSSTRLVKSTNGPNARRLCHPRRSPTYIRAI